MGGIFGKPNVIENSLVNQIINDSTIKLTSNTSSTNNVSQYIEAGGNSIVSNNRQYVDIKTNTQSIITATQKPDFQTSFNNEVAQELNKKTTSLIGSLDGLTQNQNVSLSASIKNKLSNINLTEISFICASNSNIVQSIIAKDYANVTGNSQEVKADFLTNCSASSDNSMKTISDITNSINQRATVTAENPLDFIGKALSNIALIIGIVLIAAIAGLVIFLKPPKNNNMTDSSKIDTTKNITTPNMLPVSKIISIKK